MDLTTEIEKVIKTLAEKGAGNLSADEALKFTQAALNLAHTQATLDNCKREK